MTQENADVLQSIFDKFDSIYINPIIFLEFTTILIAVFIIRYNILYKIERNKLKKLDKKKLKNIRLYIGGHCILELLLAHLLCYTVIKLTNAHITSYIINMVAGPIIGSLLAIYADNKILIPIETATGIGNVFEKINKKKDEGSDKSNNSVNITINNGNLEENSKQLPSMTLSNNQITNTEKPKLISEDDVESEDFDSKVAKAINEIKTENYNQNSTILAIKEAQDAQNLIIAENSKKLENTIADLAILKSSEMINKKIEIKKMIYVCLNRGFATPEENDKITMYYESYTALGGNHEIESLYENHYLKLDVHEERRQVSFTLNGVYDDGTGISSRYIGPDRRDPERRVYTYGEFDTEFVDDKK